MEELGRKREEVEGKWRKGEKIEREIKGKVGENIGDRVEIEKWENKA